MSDYGLKVSKKGISAVKNNDPADLIMVTKYPLAKIDPTVDTTFRTITITFLSTPPSGVETQVYQFNHGYIYEPQAWGLWNITYHASVTWIQYDQAYGYYLSSVGAGSRILKARYVVNDSTVTIYVTATDGAVDPIDLVGITIKLTLYIFVDDLLPQDYTV